MLRRYGNGRIFQSAPDGNCAGCLQNIMDAQYRSAPVQRSQVQGLRGGQRFVRRAAQQLVNHTLTGYSYQDSPAERLEPFQVPEDLVILLQRFSEAEPRVYHPLFQSLPLRFFGERLEKALVR